MPRRSFARGFTSWERFPFLRSGSVPRSRTPYAVRPGMTGMHGPPGSGRARPAGVAQVTTRLPPRQSSARCWTSSERRSWNRSGSAAISRTVYGARKGTTVAQLRTVLCDGEVSVKPARDSTRRSPRRSSVRGWGNAERRSWNHMSTAIDPTLCDARKGTCPALARMMSLQVTAPAGSASAKSGMCSTWSQASALSSSGSRPETRGPGCESMQHRVTPRSCA